MKKQIFILIFLLILVTLKSLAAINLKTGGYETDLQIRDIIKLSYNSRSLDYGYFGQGWCSSLEQEINLVPKPHLIKCNVHYDHLIFRSKNGYYYRDGSTEFRFNSTGKLTEVLYEKQIYKVSYYKGKLHKIETPADTEMIFFYSEDGATIRKITFTNNKEVLFSYKNDLLIDIFLDSQISWTFIYNEFNNLTRISHPIGTYERMEYDDGRDMLMRYTGRDLCEFSLSYKVLSSRFHFKTEFLKKCQSKITKGSSEFLLNRNSQNQYYVEQIIQIINQEKTIYKYGG